ncbi:MAG: KOW domain-containing RNA-binding protein [Clostridia bacterium]|nr:KOW domain-containing RNA-binding protein [Clostridia bacterium]
MIGSKWIVGQLVSSKAGRDADRYFLIYEVLDQSFVRVVDGDLRRVETPKRKRTKHLKPYQLVAGELAERVKSGQRVTNADVRKAIEGLRAKLES